MAGFPWDKCQTPKKDFNSLRLSFGSTVEFDLADLFHGSFEMGNTKHSHIRIGMNFSSAQFIFGIWFQVFRLI